MIARRRLAEIGIDADRLLELCRRRKAVDVAVFGSVSRGEGTDESDLDLLVTFLPGASLLDLVALERELQEETGRKVDVVSRQGLSAFIGPAILSEAATI